MLRYKTQAVVKRLSCECGTVIFLRWCHEIGLSEYYIYMTTLRNGVQFVFP